VGAGSLLLLGATGCSGGGSGSGGGETSSDPARTIEHKYGSTEVRGTPGRVVTVGYTDQDPVLALGVAPVAVREWFGEYPSATWPWAQDELGDTEPEVLPAGELNFEQISGLDPDLIIGVSSGMTVEEYATLSEIAPVVVQPDEYVDFGVPWQEQTRLVGRALGRQQRAEDLVSEVEAQFAEAREDHPEFEGASGVVVGLTSEDESYTPSPYGPQDSRSRFLESLGFEMPEEISELAGDSFFTDLSRERLGLIDTDLLVWVAVQADDFEAVKTDPLYQQLDAAQEGRDVFLEELPAGALSFSTVLSLPFALDELVPRFAAAVDGDPNTNAEAAS
ncbi:MAG: iron-siderophore ABC transporter substrate-binding protein, partial [Rubrobacteraceae bacterium]